MADKKKNKRLQRLLEQATTVDETDAIQKIQAGYSEELPFDSYFMQTADYLQKMRVGSARKYIPTSEQLRAFMSMKKYIVVIAGAGSGKTATLVNRMCKDKRIFNIPGRYILPITFTNGSADDMREQYQRLCRTFGVDCDLEFKTIHKFGSDLTRIVNPNLQILTEQNPVTVLLQNPDMEAVEMGEAEPYIEVKYTMNQIITQALEMCGFAKDVVKPMEFYSAVNIIAERMLTTDEMFRESAEDYADFPLNLDEIIQVRRVYSELKTRYGCIDFTDMLESIHNLLVNIPALYRISSTRIREYLTFKRLYIDETQDVSPLQIAIFRELLRLNPDCTLFVVGDDDQSIYGFRGGDPTFLLNFAEIFAPDYTQYPGFEGLDEDGNPVFGSNPPIMGYDEEGEPIYGEAPQPPTEADIKEDVEIIYMTKNRRSAKNIISLANTVIRNNEVRYDKSMQPLNDFNGNISLIGDVQGIMAEGLILDTLKEESGKGYGFLNHIGILYREHKQVSPILDMLVKHRIPYHCNYDEQSSLYTINSQTSRDLLGIMELISNLQNPYLVKKFLYKVCPNVTKTDAKNISQTLQAEAIKPVKTRKKLSDILKEDFRWSKDINILLNLYKMVKAGDSMYKILSPLLQVYKSAYFDYVSKNKEELVPMLERTLDYISDNQELSWQNFHRQYLSTITWISHNYKAASGVQLVTFHTSKGLEYEKVFILEVSDNCTPKATIMSKYSRAGAKRYLEEERRLMYVALTRAKRDLTVFYNQDNADNIFVKEIAKALEEVDTIATPTSD